MYHGYKKKALEYKYFLILDLEPKDLERVCKGDKMMEKYKEKIEKTKWRSRVYRSSIKRKGLRNST